MKKSQIVELFKGLQQLKNLSGVKFAYAISKNISLLEKEIESLKASINPSEEFLKFEKERVDLAKKYAEKDENDSPKISTNPQGVQEYVIENKKAFNKEIEALRKKYKKTIEERQKQYEEYKELLDTESKVELYKIKIDDVPKEITVEQMNIIKDLVE
jgi:uncharacterized coiled-coil DUF342 family protein